MTIISKHEIKVKRKARKLALQALYQWHMTHDPLYEIEAQFHATNDMSKVDGAYFHKLLAGAVKEHKTIEDQLLPYLNNRSLDNINPVELSVLRLASFELLHSLDVPYRVILDEAITLTKAFGAKDGYRYVNGVLNNFAKVIRIHEKD